MPTPDDLRDKALYYLWHRVGDAVYVGDPVRIDEGWSLPLLVKGRRGTFGQIFLTPEGDVVESRSTSASELDEALSASGDADPPARPARLRHVVVGLRTCLQAEVLNPDNLGIVVDGVGKAVLAP